MAAHLHQGRRAEERVAWWYWRRGWRIVARNWFGGGGELDLVCSRWRTLLVVEVRYRVHGPPLATIDDAKLARLLAASAALISAHHLERYRFRLDAVGLSPLGMTRAVDVLRPR